VALDTNPYGTFNANTYSDGTINANAYSDCTFNIYTYPNAYSNPYLGANTNTDCLLYLNFTAASDSYATAIPRAEYAHACSAYTGSISLILRSMR